MKKTILYSLIGFIAIASFGCMPKDQNTYTGPSQLEFKNQTLGLLTPQLTLRGIVTTTGQVQTASSRGILINTRTTDSVLVQLIGPQVSSPIVVNYSIDASSTAVEGTNYNFSTPGARTVTIPANSSSAYIFINTVPNSIATVGDTRTLKFNLLGASGIAPTPNYSVFTVTLKR